MLGIYIGVPRDFVKKATLLEEPVDNTTVDSSEATTSSRLVARTTTHGYHVIRMITPKNSLCEENSCHDEVKPNAEDHVLAGIAR